MDGLDIVLGHYMRHEWDILTCELSIQQFGSSSNLASLWYDHLLVCRIRILSEQLEDQSSKTPSLEEVSLKSEIIKQKQEMIDCLQEELIKVGGWQLFTPPTSTPVYLHLISVTVPGQTKRSREWRYNKKFTPKALGQWRGNWARTTTTTLPLLCCIVLLNPAVVLTLTTGLISRTASGSGRTSPRTAWRASRRSWPPPSCGRPRATSHSRTSGPKWAIWVQCGRNTWR